MTSHAPTNNQQIFAAMFSLSQQLRRGAHLYRRWALEAKTKPDSDRWRNQSRKDWSDAKWYLQHARMYRDGA